MSHGHWETVRGSHRDTQGDSDSEPASADACTQSNGAGTRVRQSVDVLVGWRVWRLSTPALANPRAETSHALVLVSTFMIDLWHPGKAMTACCGAKTLRHGVHAFVTQEQAMQYMAECKKTLRYVFGEVSLWGRVIIHERGYRAECAYPKRIFVPKEYRGGRDIVNELCRSYGIEGDWTS